MTNRGAGAKIATKIKKLLRGSGYQFGSDAVDYTSTAAGDFVAMEREVDQAFIDKCYKIKEDLRETHLSIGTDDVNYRTCSQDAYTEKKGQWVDPAEAAAIVQSLRESHFITGSCDDPQQYVSTKELMDATVAQHQITEDNVTKPCPAAKGANLVFGSDERTCVTTTKASFPKWTPEPIDHVDGLARNVELRKTSFCLGNDKTDYKTTTANAHCQEVADQGSYQKAKAPPLKKTNFQFGFEAGKGKLSESQERYGRVEDLYASCKYKYDDM